MLPLAIPGNLISNSRGFAVRTEMLTAVAHTTETLATRLRVGAVETRALATTLETFASRSLTNRSASEALWSWGNLSEDEANELHGLAHDLGRSAAEYAAADAALALRAERTTAP